MRSSVLGVMKVPMGIDLLLLKVKGKRVPSI
jgi:hypothetical protein